MLKANQTYSNVQMFKNVKKSTQFSECMCEGKSCKIGVVGCAGL